MTHTLCTAEAYQHRVTVAVTSWPGVVERRGMYFIHVVCMCIISIAIRPLPPNVDIFYMTTWKPPIFKYRPTQHSTAHAAVRVEQIGLYDSRQDLQNSLSRSSDGGR